MSLKEFNLGIDLGTSACKVAIFSYDGEVIGSATESYKVYYPKIGWAEQDPNEWYHAIVLAIKKLLQTCEIKNSQITGIAIDGQSWSAIPINKNGEVLRNTPIWMDTRANEICERYNQLLGIDRIFNVAGNPLQPSYSLPKIIWYKENEPDVYNQMRWVLQSNSYIAMRLTGKVTQDISQGYGFQCFDVQMGKWDKQLCKEFGINPDILPDIFQSHEIIGSVSEEAAKLTGLCVGTPVVAGGVDAACATLGAGVIHPGQTQEQGGQAGGMSVCLDQYKADKKLILGSHVIPDRWLLQGGTVGGGGILNWFKKEFGSGNSFEELCEEAAKIPHGSEGLIFLPYMSGERSPIWDIHAKGVYFGIDYSKSRGHFIRAALEGVAFSLKHNIETAEAAGATVNELHAMGGSANSILWTQIKADITGKTMRVPSSDTATTLGAAMLAGVGTGMYKSFEEAVNKTIKITREQKPDQDKNLVYSNQYESYLELYESLKNLMKRGIQS